jgi:hypothetical protein
MYIIKHIDRSSLEMKVCGEGYLNIALYKGLLCKEGTGAGYEKIFICAHKVSFGRYPSTRSPSGQEALEGWENSLQRDGGEATLFNMEKNFEPLKDRLRIICDRLDPEEQASFRPLIDNFTGITSEFQRIMRDLGKYGGKIGEGSTFGIYREVQNLFDQANRGE